MVMLMLETMLGDADFRKPDVHGDVHSQKLLDGIRHLIRFKLASGV
jgi:hypothetical protein